MQLIIAEEYLAEDGISHVMGVFTDMDLAIKTGCPVYGLFTWDIPGIIACKTPEEAVERAVVAAKGRGHGTLISGHGRPPQTPP